MIGEERREQRGNRREENERKSEKGETEKRTMRVLLCYCSFTLM